MKITGKRTTAILSAVLLLTCVSQVFALTAGEIVTGINGTDSYPALTIQSITRSYDDSVNQFRMTLSESPGRDYFAPNTIEYAYTIMISPNVSGAIAGYYSNPISRDAFTATNPGTYFNAFAAGSPAYAFSVINPPGTSILNGSYARYSDFYDANPSTIPGYSFNASGNVLTWTIPKTEVSFNEFAWLGVTSAGLTFSGLDRYGIVNGTNYAVATTPSTVPIPGAFWLFGSGLFGLVGVGRKRIMK